MEIEAALASERLRLLRVVTAKESRRLVRRGATRLRRRLTFNTAPRAALAGRRSRSWSAQCRRRGVHVVVGAGPIV
jgi:hypothetical protein